jgi:hypothetical protein
MKTTIVAVLVLVLAGCGGSETEADCSPLLSRSCDGTSIRICLARQQPDGSTRNEWVNDAFTRHVGGTGDCAAHGLRCVSDASIGAKCAP